MRGIVARAVRHDRRETVPRGPAARFRLRPAEVSATVASMATPRSRQAARLRARRRRSQQRARRLAVLAIVAALALVTLLLTAFGSGSPAQRQTPVASTPVTPERSTPLEPEVLATAGNLQLRLPVAPEEVTAIGFHGAPGDALALQPVGRQVNEGLLARLWRRIAGAPKHGPVWYQLAKPGTEVVDVGAMPGTDVYAPVDGTVAAISDYVIDGRSYGSRIDLRPTEAPAVIVSLTHVEPDPSLAVGSTTLAAASKLGTVVDAAAVERQALAAYARANGNNVAIQVQPAAGSLP